MTVEEFIGIYLAVAVFIFIVQQIDDIRINRKLDEIQKEVERERRQNKK